jgi:hypothetical protein
VSYTATCIYCLVVAGVCAAARLVLMLPAPHRRPWRLIVAATGLVFHTIQPGLFLLAVGFGVAGIGFLVAGIIGNVLVGTAMVLVIAAVARAIVRGRYA